MSDPRKNFKDLGEGTLRRIDWQELFPVLFLFRAFREAFGMRLMGLALLGIVLLFALDICYVGIIFGEEATEVLSKITETAEDTYSQRIKISPQTTMSSLTIPWKITTYASQAMWNVIMPTNETLTWEKRSLIAVWFFGVFLTMSILGGAMARIAAVKLARGGNESLLRAFRFVWQHLKSFYGALALIVAGILCCYLPILVNYYLLDVPYLNYLAAGGFFITLLFGLAAALLAIPLITGWNLLLAAVVVDRADMFDAVSRTFSYVYQRIFHYAFYTAAAIGLGALGFIAMQIVVALSLEFTLRYAESELAYYARNGSLFYLLITNGMATTTWSLQTQIVAWWITLFQLLPMAYALSFFWTASVAIYLLLRRGLDGTPLETIVAATSEEEKPFSIIERA